MTRPLTARRSATVVLAALSLTALAGCGSGDPSTVAAPPSSVATSAAPMPSGTAMAGHNMGGMSGMGAGEHTADPGKGLLVTENGFTLRPSTRTLQAGPQTLRFQILDGEGKPVTRYTADQTKLLHLYLVRQDLTGYQHLHPTLSNGTWSIAVASLTPGPYRMYTDFVAQDPAGMSGGGADRPTVLSTTLTVPGSYTPSPLPAAASSSTADGLTATMTGTLTAGTTSNVRFQVTENGTPVTDLERYLDSFAHLTALRDGDLAYQHVHPGLTAKPGQQGGPGLPFEVDLPVKGTWRLFLQVQRAGALHLLPLTVAVR